MSLINLDYNNTGFDVQWILQELLLQHSMTEIDNYAAEFGYYESEWEMVFKNCKPANIAAENIGQ